MRHTLNLGLAAAMIATGLGLPNHAATAASQSAYVQEVMKDRPVAMLHGKKDLAGQASATAVGQPAVTRLPNGDVAHKFNGKGQYLNFGDRKAFEVDNTGVLTVEYWMRPDTLQFTRSEGSGYAYVMGKGKPNAHEWHARMYSKTNAESRPNRISGYSFNPRGGLGAGSYFQDKVTVGQWIHVALVINSRARSAAYPMGYSKIYKNGVLRDTDSLADYNIVPRSGNAPLRVGTGYLGSFFEGGIGAISFYDKELGAGRVSAHHRAMSGASTGSDTSARPSKTTKSRAISGVDTRRRAGKLIRYTPKHGARTRTNKHGLEATVVRGKVVAVRNGVGNTKIPRNGYVLSGHGTARTWLKKHVKVGARAKPTKHRITIVR